MSGEGVTVVRRPGEPGHSPIVSFRDGAVVLTGCADVLQSPQGLALADVDPGDLCRRCFPDPARLTEAIERLEGREEGVRGAESDVWGEVGSECGGESIRPSDRRNEGE